MVLEFTVKHLPSTAGAYQTVASVDHTRDYFHNSAFVYSLEDLTHILLIHLSAAVGAVISGYKWLDMALTTAVNAAPQLKGYGFNLVIVYLIWIELIVVLYPVCRWFDRYKKANIQRDKWLSYL